MIVGIYLKESKDFYRAKMYENSIPILIPIQVAAGASEVQININNQNPKVEKKRNKIIIVML